MENSQVEGGQKPYRGGRCLDSCMAQQSSNSCTRSHHLVFNLTTRASPRTALVKPYALTTIFSFLEFTPLWALARWGSFSPTTFTE